MVTGTSPNEEIGVEEMCWDADERYLPVDSEERSLMLLVKEQLTARLEITSLIKILSD